MKLKRATLIILLLMFGLVCAKEEFDWSKPSYELLQQTVCPLDSTADAMVVQKETQYTIIHDRGHAPYLKVVSKERIKIYTEKGLTYAEHKEFYNDDIKIKSIKAYCYMPRGTAREVSKSDIHDEIWYEFGEFQTRNAS